MRGWKTCLVAFLLLLGGVPAAGQEDEDPSNDDTEAVPGQIMEIDRPLIIRVPDLENNQVQVEIDVLLTRDRDGSPTKLRFPFLLRADVGPNVELRLQTDFVTLQNPNLGFGDITVGTKWQMGPRTSLVAGVQMPTGSPAFTDDAFEPKLTLAQEIPLAQDWLLTINTGLDINKDSDSGKYYGEFIAAGQLAYHVTPQTQLSLVLSLKSPDALDGINRLTGALGVSHILDDHNRLTLTAGRSFSATGDDYLVVFGWAHRI